MKKAIGNLLDMAITIALFGGIGYGIYLGPKEILHEVKVLTIEQIKKQDFSMNKFSRKMTGNLDY